MLETSRLKPPQPDGCVWQGRGTNTGYLGTRSCSSWGEQKGCFPRRASQKLKALCVCVCFSILLLLGKNKGVVLLGDVCAGGHAEGKASVSPQSTPGCCRCLEPPQVSSPLPLSLLLQAMASFLALINPICWQQPSASPARQPRGTKARKPRGYPPGKGMGTKSHPHGAKKQHQGGKPPWVCRHPSALTRKGHSWNNSPPL